MNSATTYSTTTNSPEQSSALGAKLGHALRGGEVVELVSDLGGGKTTFIQGLARGLGYLDAITSPTFTISRIYRLPDGRELHHFDFYRLNDRDIVNAELAEVIGEPDVVVAIEWAEHAAKVLPKGRVVVQIERLSDQERRIVITAAPAIIQKVQA